ncbi:MULTISPECIES: hypothetical protein [Haloferax]|uniref:Uncharacterized protein n=1 Tax=Haloferax marinum TaxID=2666143 RepID=A0A6A8G3E9_9EURY|nr:MULTISPECIES: hypothetical protein [Haloferax]KAB1196424.1 hypothetical protein Hfx1150_02375 [Haloferax sp. CBA1150]MRW95419.1 hypothetical protein [Haloferax marinum]
MPSSASAGDAPPEATAVARRYHRLERSISGAVALLSVGVVAAAILFAPLLVGLLVALAVVVLLRIPLFRTSGTARLASTAEPRSVLADFESATPPLLAFQWGVADSVQSEVDGAVYDFSYLFGLRSVRMETTVRSVTASESDSSADLELDVTADGNPWGTYSVSIHEGASRTLADIDWESSRKFGLRRLPQWFVAERYRAEMLTAQGYRVLDRDASLSLSV